MTPRLYRVTSRIIETSDVVTLSLAPLSGEPQPFLPGQFNMLTALGVGEVAISISSAPGEDPLEHTIRDVGPVTRALCDSEVGTVVGVRGPFGSDWALEEAGTDVVVVAGGIGIAPLRGAVRQLAARQAQRAGRLFVLMGARQPGQVIYSGELREWMAAGAHVEVTVDRAEPGWGGPVGLVTSLLPGAGFDAASASALICGPEIMMRLTAKALIELGVAQSRIRVSLERNMQCGVGWCGHCQLGPLLLCRDGPVVPYRATVEDLLTHSEL